MSRTSVRAVSRRSGRDLREIFSPEMKHHKRRPDAHDQAEVVADILAREHRDEMNGLEESERVEIDQLYAYMVTKFEQMTPYQAMLDHEKALIELVTEETYLKLRSKWRG